MNRVALTFDNGPEPGVTDAVLDILGAHGIAATFFVIGRKLASPEGRRLAERARGQGHRLGNHTYTHSVPLGQLPDDASVREIADTQALLAGLAPERLFRPYGEQGRIGPHLLSRAAWDYLAAEKYTCVLWNAVPGDWRDPDGWVEAAVDMCARQDWSVVVLHDLPTGAMRHLPRFLDALGAIGADFVQEFPPECVPIAQGVLRPGAERYVTPAA